MRKLASTMMPTSLWFIENGVLHARVACKGAKPGTRTFETGVISFDDPNLGCSWEVQTFWIGETLVTSERTRESRRSQNLLMALLTTSQQPIRLGPHSPPADGLLNGGRPIVISRWIEANGPRMVSRYEWTTEDGVQHKSTMWDLAFHGSSPEESTSNVQN